MKRLLATMFAGLIACGGFFGIDSFKAEACTRVVYEGNDSLIIVGRSLDWKTPIPTNVYVYPRGMKKKGSNEPNAVKWTSKYGAVYAVGYDAGVTEGMNEAGLSVNGLFCKGTVYSNPTNDNRPSMSLAVFPAWILDLCSTTDEAVALIQNQDFTLSGATFDGGTVSTLHWGITDRSGHSVIVEFVNGDITIHDMGSYHCMTNDPNWPQMRGIIDYWAKIGGTNFLPGSVSSPDRCVRGSFFIDHVDKTADADLGASIVRTVMNNVSVPYTYHTSDNGEPNVSMTQWRSFSNLRDLRYYFDLATNNGFNYVDLSTLDLYPGAPVLKLVTADQANVVGNANNRLIQTKPFTPMY